MHVVFTVLRDIEVDDKVDSWNIEASAGYVSCNQNLSLTCFELVQCIQSLSLRQLPIDVDRFEVKVAEDQSQLHALVARCREYDCLESACELSQ